jgi:hypothetical protein
MGGIILKFLDFNESLINETNTTLELRDLCTKSHLLLKVWPSNLVAEHQIDALCNENYIITHSRLAPIPEECIIYDNIVMFHV